MNTDIVYRNAYPTVPGWYWWLVDGYASVVHRSTTECHLFGDKPTASNEFYAGPLTPPVRPEKAKC